MSLIESLNWRYATKKFDPSKKISERDLATIKEAISLSATSYGLELYKVLIIEDKEIRKQLQPASWGQTQVVDASHLLVFCNYNSVKPEHVSAYTSLKARLQGIEEDKLKGYGDFIINQLSERSEIEKNIWTARQTYIALGNLLAVCGELKIDSCPMEGFDPGKYDKILGLSEKGLSAAVVATIGYRSSEDDSQHAAKVRKPLDLLFETV